MEAVPPDKPEVANDQPATVKVRMGRRSCMTSKGPCRPYNSYIRWGAILELPKAEADNLVNMGYATYA